MRVLDVDGGTETPRVFGDIVAKDDGPHRRLAGARLALRTSALGRTGGRQCGADTHHQQNLLLAAFSFLHRGAWWWWVCGWYSGAGAGAGGLTGCGVVVVVWRGREGGGQRQAPMYTYVTRDLADMGCHSAAGRVARLVERAPSCAHGGGGCWVRVPAHLFCARGRRSRPPGDRQLRGTLGGTVCACARLPNKSLALSFSVLEQSQTDRSEFPDQTPHILAQHRNRAPSEQGSAVPDATVATRRLRPPRSYCPSAYLPICRTEHTTHGRRHPRPHRHRAPAEPARGMLCPPRPAPPAPCALSALTPDPGPGVTPGHAGRRLPAAAGSTHTGQTPIPAGHARHAQP